jgi:hypothetical protein
MCVETSARKAVLILNAETGGGEGEDSSQVTKASRDPLKGCPGQCVCVDVCCRVFQG